MLNSVRVSQGCGEVPALLHINIPFCVQPCDWQPDCKVLAGWDSQRMKVYMDAVRREIIANAPQFSDMRIDAVRFGGGIASNAGEDISVTMRCIHDHLNVAADAPVTMRSSVSNISGANMTWFKRAGICRFDFEMMSLNQMDFFRLNKTDSLADFKTVCDYILRPYETNLLGLVLTYGHAANTAQATVQNFKTSVMQAILTHAKHIKLVSYCNCNAATGVEKDEQLTQARELLEQNGFIEYIPLHFAPDGLQDRYFMARHLIAKHAGVRCGCLTENSVENQGTHNIANVVQLGFGLGAHTVADGIASTNTMNLDLYLNNSHDFTVITDSVNALR